MKEELKEEILDLRRFENPINPLEYIQSITSNSNSNTDHDPFYVVDLEDICNKHINWLTRLPRVEPHYAVKCNTDKMLLRLLAYLGAGFDCASKAEIETILRLGVSPRRIIFANPCKQASMIKHACKSGVHTMTFDNEHELHKIKQLHPGAKVVLRIKTDDKSAVCQFSIKFGADAPSAYRLVRTAVELELDLVGVSFHCGSGQMDPLAFSESIANARNLFDYARETFNCKMYLLDIGGGYPGDSSGAHLFNSISREINKSLEQLFPQDFFDALNGTEERRLRIIAEPGRYYAASAFTLCVNVIAKRVTQASEQQEAEQRAELASRDSRTPVTVREMNGEVAYETQAIDTSRTAMYYVNDGVYASFNCLFYDHCVVEPIMLGNKCQSSGKLVKSSIWGPTCDGLDCINKVCYIPELEIGEFLAYKDMGAYTLSGAVAFNGIPLAKCIYTASASWNIIKEAFTDTEDEEISRVLRDASSKTCAVTAANFAFPNAFKQPIEVEESGAEF